MCVGVRVGTKSFNGEELLVKLKFPSDIVLLLFSLSSGQGRNPVPEEVVESVKVYVVWVVDRAGRVLEVGCVT